MVDNRYINKGVSKIYFIATMAGSVPTRSEITAGLLVSDRLADLAGWNVEGNSADSSDWSSAFEKKVPGTFGLADSSLTFHANKSGSDTIRAALPRLAIGTIAIMNAGDIPGTGKMNLFPVQVRTLGDVYSNGNDTSKFRVQFDPTDVPTVDATIPA